MRVTQLADSQLVEFDSLDDLRAVANGDAWRATGARLENQKRELTERVEKIVAGDTFYVGNYPINGIAWFELLAHPDLPAFESRYKEFAAGDWLGLCTSRRRVRRFTEDDGEYLFERHGSDRPFESNAYTMQATSHRGQVDLICQVGGASGLTTAQLENAGLATCALADKLESDGYRVRIIGARRGSHWRKEETPSVESVILKRHDEPLDIGKAGLVLACGPFYRTVWFHMRAKTSAKLNDNMGWPEPLELSKLTHLGLSEVSVIVPTMLSVEAAKSFVHRVAGEVVTA